MGVPALPLGWWSILDLQPHLCQCILDVTGHCASITEKVLSSLPARDARPPKFLHPIHTTEDAEARSNPPPQPLRLYVAVTDSGALRALSASPKQKTSRGASTLHHAGTCPRPTNHWEENLRPELHIAVTTRPGQCVLSASCPTTLHGFCTAPPSLEGGPTGQVYTPRDNETKRAATTQSPHLVCTSRIRPTKQTRP